MILLTGATGTAGSFIAKEFVRERVPVRILVWNRAKAAGLEKVPTVEIVEGDMSKRSTLGPALEGVDRVLMISAPVMDGRNAVHVYRRQQGRRCPPRDQILWFGRSARYHISFWSYAQGN
jgi:uncharacterized protein YbjT (DUF2867 family)